MRREVSFELAEPFASAREHMLGTWVEDLAKVHAWPENGGEDGITYKAAYYKWWVYLLSVVLFPVGLLTILVGKRYDFLQVELTADGGATLVEVAGTARRKVWRIVEGWVRPR